MRAFYAMCRRVGLDLEPFQRAIAREFASGRGELLVLLPRGNGKTTLMAALAVHHLLTVERAAVYCAAASREQARILFEAAAGFARALAHPNVAVRHLELRWCPDPAQPKVFTRHMRVLAADAPRLHGLDPTLAIIDELHAHPNDQLYLALRTAMLKQRRSKLVTISTAGSNATGALGTLRSRALAQPSVSRNGGLTRAQGRALAMLEWAVPEHASADDLRWAKRANPASWITADALREQHEAVHQLAYERFHLNRWTQGEHAWLPPGAWQRCAGSFEIEPGEDVFVGVDVGGARAASAVVWVTPDLRVGCAIYQGDAAVLDVEQKVRELASELTVHEVAYDPWRFREAALKLEAEGLRMIEFQQTNSRMTPASERLHAAITEGRLRHDGDPELARHVASAVAKDTGRGWRVDKRGRSDQVDAVIALAMALERAEQPAPTAELVGWL